MFSWTKHIGVPPRKPDDLPAFCNTLIGAFAQDKS